ncbi:hypothetical protein M422DRAFT_247501 [Sphaerobolus stellatus SS14]|nr:hypothetical protein M422DRAFT_247501 [Sphaerobolus stellatus SS14]
MSEKSGHGVILEDGAASPHSEVPNALPYARVEMGQRLCIMRYASYLTNDFIITLTYGGMSSSRLFKKDISPEPRPTRQAVEEPSLLQTMQWTDAPINFAPMYKYDCHSDETLRDPSVILHMKLKVLVLTTCFHA